MPMQEMTLINLIILNEMLLFKIAIFCIFRDIKLIISTSISKIIRFDTQ